MKTGRKAVVIGAGLGGISAAISLAQAGFAVEVFEKNPQIGGKLNRLRTQGYTFDLGPSILTLPQFFERLFERSGRRMSDYFPIQPLRPHWRCFFEGSAALDLHPDPAAMDAAAERAAPGAAGEVRAFLEYAARQYDRISAGYFEEGLDTPLEILRFYGLREFLKFDFWHTMHGGVARRIRDPRLRDVFDFFIKYVGSSAYDAPGFMNCLPTIQFRHDLWYVPGGMYRIAEGLGQLMEELGIRVHLNCEVARILTAGRRATGLRLADGTEVWAETVVSNLEVVPACRDLLGASADDVRRLERRLEPACSGLVIDLGLDCQYEQLAHHNFFFSGNQREHFRSVFRKKELPHDPTLYVVSASRTDPTVAPPGCDGLKILPHIPYLTEERPYTRDDYLALKDRVIAKLERMGLTDLRRHIVVEHVWTPFDIEQMYHSNRGSIYGVVSNLWKNLAFKAPKQSPQFENLFFTGGSVNPGGGMPMVVLCGQQVARRAVAQAEGPSFG
jgi:diapolycopene oxygenase